MNKYLLDSYSLTGGQLARSLLISEYGLRHLEKADAKPKYAFGHRFIAAIELIPVVGLIISLVEAIFNAISKALQPIIQPGAWIFMGSQSRCNGTYDSKKAEKIVRRLNGASSPGILFNASKLNGSITGGTCSAMAIKLIKTYLHAKTKATSEKEGLNPERLLMKLFKKGYRFEESSAAYRATQAAFNTIEINASPLDPSRSKVESLVRWEGLDVSWSSPCYLLKNQPSGTTESTPYGKLASAIDGFEEGIYLIRALEPAANEKLEAHGHTVVYIKENGLHLFYDANEGLDYLNTKNASVAVEKYIRYSVDLFNTTDVSFYRIKELRKKS